MRKWAFLFLLISTTAHAQLVKPKLLSGCIDCFNFAAPSVAGVSTVTSPQIGLILLDTSANKFKGYSSITGWQDLTNDSKISINTITSNYTATTQNDLIQGNAASINVNLPSASSCSGKILKFKNISSSGTLSVSPNIGDTIEGASAVQLPHKLDYLEIVSNGTGWNITNSRIAPTFVQFTSGSSTYIPPGGVHHLRVRIVGGGGGGSGSGGAPSGGLAQAGTATSFGGTLMVANGGGAGGFMGPGGAGGTATIAAGQTGITLSGGSGQGSQTSGNSPIYGVMHGGMGGSSAFGGGGGGGAFAITGAGLPASPNTGGGGGGAGNTSSSGSNNTGGGGGAGGYAELIIQAPSMSGYATAVGTGGAAGPAGINGIAGGAGASGIILVEEFYQ